MAKAKTRFVCRNCGYEAIKWMGKCPSCGEFNSFSEETEIPVSAANSNTGIQSDTEPQKLDSIKPMNEGRISTGMGELDRVLGGGVVSGSLTLIGGEPGIGKSTLILQICSELSKQKKKVLYVSGEESAHQIKLRADRLSVDAENIKVLSETSMLKIYNTVERENPDFLVIDSIQTMYIEGSQSAPGSPKQVTESTSMLMNISKGKNISVIIIGHVTKEGSFAGPRTLEHMVDTLLYFEGDKTSTHRILRAVKNRFGGTNEISVFEMKSTGLSEILNPSAYMLSDRPKGLPGSVVSCTLEGTRPLLVEVQALACFTSFNMPRRMATGADFNRMAIITAVLEKRAGLQLSKYDIYVNLTGGIRVTEPSIDAAIAAAITSSYKNTPVADDTFIFGEIGLTGELRAVTDAKKRVQEAKKLGFTSCILPRANLKEAQSIDDITLIGVHSIGELLRKAL